MELRPGYKETEVGMIPEDWEVRTLGDISDIYRGASPRPIESPIWFDEKSQIGWVRISDVTKSKRRLQETTQRLSELGVRHSRFVPKGSLIMSICATVGRPVITDIDVCIHDGFVVFERQQVLQDFLYHSLKALESDWSKSGQTGSQMNLNTGIINPTRIPFPPTKAEQEAIAVALSDADALIESLGQLITKKRDIKHGAMQELLTGKKRLPGFSGEWKLKQLGDIAPLQRGFDLPNPQLKLGPFPVVYSNGVLNYHAAFQVLGPGVVTGRSGTIGKVSYVQQNFWPHNTSLWVTTFKGNDPKFVFFLFTRIGLERFATGSGVPTLNRNDVHAFKVSIPTSIEEQVVIATILSDMDAEIAALETKLTKTRSIKQGMMHNLLTGRIRLIDQTMPANLSSLPPSKENIHE